MSLPILRNAEALRTQLQSWKQAGLRVALVPTMGCLHAGHLRLVEEAALHADRVLVSIFVNPLQFSAGEDLDRYPRTLEADCLALQSTRAAAVFAPADADLYPHGREGLTEVRVPDVSGRHCGQFRPGHFEGVTTVVNILFNLTQPDVAVFGEKDCQQLFVIRRMVRDLHMPVEIVGVPTVREDDGLAMSSRNRYLSASQRQQAARFPAVLDALSQCLQHQPDAVDALCAQAWKELESAGLRPQYLDLVDADFMPAQSLAAGEFTLLAAVQVGEARLIDNRILRIAAS